MAERVDQLEGAARGTVTLRRKRLGLPPSPWLTYDPRMAAALGDPRAAILFAYLDWETWAGAVEIDDTAEQLSEGTGIAAKQLPGVRKLLRAAGVLLERSVRVKGRTRLHFRVDSAAVDRILTRRPTPVSGVGSGGTARILTRRPTPVSGVGSGGAPTPISGVDPTPVSGSGSGAGLRPDAEADSRNGKLLRSGERRKEEQQPRAATAAAAPAAVGSLDQELAALVDRLAPEYPGIDVQAAANALRANLTAKHIDRLKLERMLRANLDTKARATVDGAGRRPVPERDPALGRLVVPKVDQQGNPIVLEPPKRYVWTTTDAGFYGEKRPWIADAPPGTSHWGPPPIDAAARPATKPPVASGHPVQVGEILRRASVDAARAARADAAAARSAAEPPDRSSAETGEGGP